ncbi:hypothetical protein [Spiroplasma endosymbiont of Polydrusus formosus]|uniref:hypothetical protein n=1 Tax=Spiroplasma endosymbiont of Polydrusus formosus TaxID=3139326 RepID=UPI0035B55C62
MKIALLKLLKTHQQSHYYEVMNIKIPIGIAYLKSKKDGGFLAKMQINTNITIRNKHMKFQNKCKKSN